MSTHEPVYGNGASEHYDAKGNLHREDGPAVEFPPGTHSFYKALWYQHGKRHRVDGPATEEIRGGWCWYQHGKRHRVDGPANSDGRWYLKGKLHRTDGPATNEHGCSQWYQHGKLHRVGGPAIEFQDSERKEWFFNGKRHREDGPAIIHANGVKEWYIHGHLVNEDEVAAMINATECGKKVVDVSVSPTKQRAIDAGAVVLINGKRYTVVAVD